MSKNGFLTSLRLLYYINFKRSSKNAIVVKYPPFPTSGKGVHFIYQDFIGKFA